jgi:hypothetical protein
MKKKELRRRLIEIAQILEQVDCRCLSVDGPVPPTVEEITQEEISYIYSLAMGANFDG